jgi:hypothetical protein
MLLYYSFLLCALLYVSIQLDHHQAHHQFTVQMELQNGNNGFLITRRRTPK